MPNKEPLFKIPAGQELRLPSAYPNLNNLEQLDQFGVEVANEVFSLITIPNLTSKAEIAKNHMRAGFIGTVLIENTTLIHDGVVQESRKEKPITLDGLLFKLDLKYVTTGDSPIPHTAGLVIGHGIKHLEIRAYDLSTKRYGEISCKALKDYLRLSSLKGGGTGTDRIRTTALKSRSRQQTKPRN